MTTMPDDLQAPRRETDAPSETFTQQRAKPWPDPKLVNFTLDRGLDDPHNMQNRHAPLKRRSTDLK